VTVTYAPCSLEAARRRLRLFASSEAAPGSSAGCGWPNRFIGQQPYYNLNQPTISGFITAFGSTPSVCNRTPKPGDNYCITQTATRRFFSTPTLLTPQAVRYFGNNASDNYNALQTKVEERFGTGYSVLSHYTWAKGLDYDGNYFRVNPRIGYGPGNFDRTHSFVLANLWSLPVGRGHALFGKVGLSQIELLAAGALTRAHNSCPS